jgi:hypothetical protein
MRLAQKPLQLVLDENLKCLGLGLPPDEIIVNKDVFTFEGKYQISTDFLEKYGIKDGGKISEIAVEFDIKVPNKT